MALVSYHVSSSRGSYRRYIRSRFDEYRHFMHVCMNAYEMCFHVLLRTDSSRPQIIVLEVLYGRRKKDERVTHNPDYAAFACWSRFVGHGSHVRWCLLRIAGKRQQLPSSIYNALSLRARARSFLNASSTVATGSSFMHGVPMEHLVWLQAMHPRSSLRIHE